MKQPSRLNRYFSYLFYQVINIIAPIILLPFLTRVLGPEKLGIVNFYDGLGQTFITICSAGVLVVATREMSNHSNEESRKSEVSSIFKFHLISTILGIGVLIIYTILSYTDIDPTLLFCASLMVFLSAFKFEYIFQGLNKFGFLAKRSLIIRILFVLSVLFFIKSPNDYKIYFIILTCSSLLYSIISLVFSYNHIYFFKFFNLGIVINGLRKSFKVSISNILTGIYSNLDILILVKFVPLREVGIYVLGIKLVKFFSGIINSFSVSEYPTMSKLYFEGSIQTLHSTFRNIYLFILILTIPIAIFFSIYSSFIVTVISGTSFSESSVILKLASSVIIFSTLNTILINQLAIFHKDLYILIYGALALIAGGVFLYFFINLKGILGAAVSVLSIEILCNIYLMITVFKICKISFNLLQYIKVAFIGLFSFLSLFYVSNLFIFNQILSISFTGLVGLIIYYLLLDKFSVPVKQFITKQFWIKN